MENNAHDHKMESQKTLGDAEQVMLQQLELLQKVSKKTEDHNLSAISQAMAAIYTAIK